MKISFHSRIANYIAKNKALQKILKKADANPSLFNSSVAAGIAIIAKPTTLLSIKTDNKEKRQDNKYAAARGVSTGIADLIIGFAIFIPLNKRIDSIGRQLHNLKGTIYHNNKEMCSNGKSKINRLIKIGLLPLFAYLKFAILQPTVNFMFKEKNNK